MKDYRLVARLALAGAPMLVALAALANTSCWISNAPGDFTANYSDAGNVRVGTSIAVTCQTSSAAQSVSYTLIANDGLNPAGSQNRAKFGTSYVDYDLYMDTACMTPWSGLANTLIANPSGKSATVTISHCVKPTSPAPLAALHTDIESITLYVSTPGVVITGSNPWVYPVAIGVPTSCQISTPPGDVDFGTYAAFSPSARNASSSFTVRCSTSNVSLTADIGGNDGGVVPNTGLNYSLAINSTTSGGSNPFSTSTDASGSRTLFINGHMPANQAGTCSSGSCSGQETRTLTITY